MEGVAVAALYVMEGEPGPLHKERLDQRLIPLISFQSFETLDGKAQAALAWIDRLAPQWICFWNLRPELKLLLAKVLAATDVRICDVSPGPMYFDELAASAKFQHRIALPANNYMKRLNAFVAKYSGGTRGRGIAARNAIVIRNGMSPPPSFIPLPPPRFVAARAKRGLAIGTCCRIVPDKRIEFLLETMHRLNKMVSGASLTIVGGPDQSSVDYFDQAKAEAWVKGLHNVSFVGEQEDVLPFLNQFDVFMLVGDRQGCPNAGLEAMAMGLPLIVFGSGGASEQLVDEVNGYVVKNAADAATKLADLHGDPRKRRRMGKASKRLWEEEFTLPAMGKAYAELFR
jgi:glycosyltransferase involved in cell wall biosynthesis